MRLAELYLFLFDHESAHSEKSLVASLCIIELEPAITVEVHFFDGVAHGDGLVSLKLFNDGADVVSRNLPWDSLNEKCVGVGIEAVV